MNTKPRKISGVDVLGIMVCMVIIYSFDYMSLAELALSLITIPCAIVFWTIYGALLDALPK